MRLLAVEIAQVAVEVIGHVAWVELGPAPASAAACHQQCKPCLERAERCGKKGRGVKEPADLLKLPQIDPGDIWWRAWFEGAGWPTDALPMRQAPKMGSQAYEAIAAIGGRGVAMLTPVFYKQELASGALIQPFDHVGSDGSGFWLVYPEERRNVPKIKVFREWILAEIERTLGPAG